MKNTRFLVLPISLLFLACTFYSASSNAQITPEELKIDFTQIVKYARTKPLSAIKKIKPKLRKYKENKNHLGIAYSYLALYWANNFYENYKNGTFYIDSLDDVVRTHNLSELNLDLYNAKSRHYYDKDKTISNLLVIDSLYHEAELRKDSFNMGGALAIKANAYSTRSEFDKAMEYYNRSLEIFRAIKSEKGLQSITSMMGMYYGRRGEKEKGRRDLITAFEIAKKRKDTLAMIRGLSNISGSYALSKNVEKTQEAIELRSALIDKMEYPQAKKHTINVALFYIESGLYMQGLRELELVEKYYDLNPNLKRQALAKHWKAIAYRGLDDYASAAVSSKEGFEISQKINHLALSQISAYTLFQTFHWRDKNKEAIDWLLKYQEIKDTIYSEEKTKEILNLETKYETIRKEQEIEILKANAERDKAKRNQLWTILLTLGGLGLFLLYTLNLKRVKERQLQLEKFKNIELEKSQLEQQLNFKEKELTSQLLHLAKKNEQLTHISESLKELKLASIQNSDKLISKLQRQIKQDLTSSEVWEQFIQSFKTIHKNFIRTMVDKFELTSGELKLASLLKMNFTNKEIANLLNITNEGIKKARYRLRKKLNLKVGESLDELILSIK